MRANSPIKKPTPAVRPGSRIKVYYDKQKIVKNTSAYYFFPANASQVDQDNNYVTNPFPGNKTTEIRAIAIDSTLQVIPTKADIDPIKIINALKDASLKVTTDQNNQEMILGLLKDYFNFETTSFSQVGGVGTADAVFKETAIELRSKGAVELADPFKIAPGQVFKVRVEFGDSSLFPTEAHWTTASIGEFGLVVQLHVVQY